MNFLGINDGAAVVVLSSGSQLQAKGLKPLAKILGFVEVGIDPMSMGLGPIGAVNKLVNILIICYSANLNVLFKILRVYNFFLSFFL